MFGEETPLRGEVGGVPPLSKGEYMDNHPVGSHFCADRKTSKNRGIIGREKSSRHQDLDCSASSA